MKHRGVTAIGSLLVVVTLAGVLDVTPLVGTVSGETGAPPSAFTTERFITHWWVFPAAVVFSTIALAAGVSGALFFSPFFMLVVGLTPAQAIGAGLLTELFGMGNGLRAYVGQGVVDYRTAKWLLAGAVPAVVVGAVLAHYVDPRLLKLVFGVGLVALGSFLVYYDPPEEYEPGESETEFLTEKNTQQGQTRIETRDGETFVYDTCWRPPGVSLATVGGFITGLISAGLPEVVTTQLIVRCRIPPRVAVATSVFTLAVAAAAGALVHALSATPVWWVVAWSVPGVVVGGTIGTRVGKYVPSDLMEIALGVVFSVVGLLVLGVELLA